MANKLKLAMFRELEAERDKARTWAARWKRAAKDWKENAYLSDNEAKRWRGYYQKVVAEQNELKAERDKLKVGFQELVHRWDGLAGYNPLMTPADNWNQLRAKIDQLKTLPALLQTCEAQLAEELRRRAELEQELRLNASMLARQCDLAREAETERDELIRECDQVTTEVGAMTSVVNVADDMVRAYKNLSVRFWPFGLNG